MDDITWIERLATDASLRAFVDAEVCRADIEWATVKSERDHWKLVAERLAVQIEEERTPEERAARSNRQRQRTWRQKHDMLFVPSAD